MRGLAGPALPTMACRSRLCHFTRYWHSSGVELVEDSDVFGHGLASAQSGGVAPAPTSSAAAILENSDDDFDASVDGEPLTAEDIAALENMDESLVHDSVSVL